MRVICTASGEQHAALSQGWGTFLQAALPGVHLLPVPNLGTMVCNTLEAFGIDGLLLTGGEDWGVHPVRDETERVLFNWSLARGCPIMGICRGAQVINKLLGGSLTKAKTDAHVGTRHDVWLAGKSLSVNSYHNNVIRPPRLASCLTPLAIAPDETVEAFVFSGRQIAGILWHPEREVHPQEHDIVVFRDIFGKGEP